MTHGQRDLDVDRPDDASEHGGPHGGHVSRLTAVPESLVVEDVDAEEEDGQRAVDAVRHPSQDSVPVEEEILRSLLVQCRELQKQCF